jgi:hypothetical protein
LSWTEPPVRSSGQGESKKKEGMRELLMLKNRRWTDEIGSWWGWIDGFGVACAWETVELVKVRVKDPRDEKIFFKIRQRTNNKKTSLFLSPSLFLDSFLFLTMLLPFSVSRHAERAGHLRSSILKNTKHK